MAYTPVFTPTYEDGWEDLPLETTPITAEALNNYDEAIEYIEEYLEQGGGGTDTSIIAEEYDSTKTYSKGDYVIYESKLYLNGDIDPTTGDFDPSVWNEVTVADELKEHTSDIGRLTTGSYRKVDDDILGKNQPRDGYLANYAIQQGHYFYMRARYTYPNEKTKFCVALIDIAINDLLEEGVNFAYTTISEALASGGGGTTVVANPVGTPTDNLDTIQIGNTIYDIPGSGGGSSTLAGLTDTTITSPTSGQVLKYDATNQKWVNANESGGGNSDSYSTTEQAIGTWVDGRTIYRKCFTITSVSPPNPGNWCTLADVSITDLDFIIKGFGYLSTTKVAKIYGWKINNNNVQCIYHTGDFKPATGEIISVDYVKTTV